MNKKIYLCGENTLCMTDDPCSKGKELSGCPVGTQQSREIYSTGLGREYEVYGFTVHLKYMDGTEEIRHTALEFRKGCNNREKT
jgi:hypothetical protein